MMYKVIKKFAVQSNEGKLSWYDVGDTVDKDVTSRLSTHALPGLVEPIKAKRKPRKSPTKNK